MKNKIFMVDTENINRRFIYGIKELNHADRIIVFYSEEAQMTMEILSALASTKAKIERYRVKQHTKNAMDFQICTYLGMLVQRYGANYDYFIVSLDKGYTAALEFLKEQYPEIMVDVVKNCNCDKWEEEVRASLDTLLESFPRRVRKEAEEAVKRSNNVAELHNYLQANLHADGKIVYQTIKPYYHQLKSA